MPLPRLLNLHQHMPARKLEAMLNHWFYEPIGQRVLDEERHILNALLPTFFGYHLSCHGSIHGNFLVDQSPISHKFYAGHKLETYSPISFVISENDAVPLASDSIDVAIMHHSLDIAPNPHGVLSEVARTVLPGGKLIVLGFNPWSLWGLWRIFRLRASRVPWNMRFLSPHRLIDWLKLVGFEFEGIEHACFGLPVAHPKMHRRFVWLERLGERWWRRWGGVYIIVATKRTSCMTPIRPHWRQGRSRFNPVSVAAGSSVARPTTIAPPSAKNGGSGF